MTVIVATYEGVWADRRVSSDGSVYRPCRKVVRGAVGVAAFCGGSAACARAMRAVKAGVTDLHALAEISDGIVVTPRGRYELSEKDARRVPASVPFLVHGSGYAEAQAYLYGAGSWDRATIRRAMGYVARVRSDCGDGVDFAALTP